MRPVHLPALLAFALLAAPTPALAQSAGGASGTAAPGAEPPRSLALALTVEIVSPLGGPGCFYRRRALAGVLVAAGSLIGGGLLLYAAHHADPDGVIISAVAYGAMRGIGVAAAAAPAASPPDPPRAGALPAITPRPLGLSYGFSF